MYGASKGRASWERNNYLCFTFPQVVHCDRVQQAGKVIRGPLYSVTLVRKKGLMSFWHSELKVVRMVESGAESHLFCSHVHG